MQSRWPASKALFIYKGNRDSVAKRIQKVVVSLGVFVSDPKAFDLIDKMIPRFTFVNAGLVERIVRVLDIFTIDVTGNRNCAFVLAHRRQL